MSKLLLSPDDYKEISGFSFYDSFVKPQEDEMNRRRCAYCGAKNPFTKDHVIPKSRGGSDDINNLVWACISCNSKKGNKTPEEAGMSIIHIKESKVNNGKSTV